MNAELGREVQWIDETDGGWRTGSVVMFCDFGEVVDARFDYHENRVLVKESCDGRLSWVPESNLLVRPLRSTFEDKDGKPLRVGSPEIGESGGQGNW